MLMMIMVSVIILTFPLQVTASDNYPISPQPKSAPEEDANNPEPQDEDNDDVHDEDSDTTDEDELT